MQQSTFQKIDWLTNGLHSKIIFGFGLWIALQNIGVLKYPVQNSLCSCIVPAHPWSELCGEDGQPFALCHGSLPLEPIWPIYFLPPSLSNRLTSNLLEHHKKGNLSFTPPAILRQWVLGVDRNQSAAAQGIEYVRNRCCSFGA